VGGNLPIAAGIAMSCKMKKTDNIAVCFFGDGASNEGSFHETLNAASMWKLPVVFVCENNLYPATTSIKLTCPIEDVAAGRGSAYNIPAEVVDGNDVIAVNEAAARAIERARKGEGPTILELKTYRIGNTGLPETADEFYELSGGGPLTAISEFSTATLDSATGKGNYATLKIVPGTMLYFWRSDGAGLVDMYTASGQLCRFYVSGKRGEQRVNGMSAEGCFEGMVYKP